MQRLCVLLMAFALAACDKLPPPDAQGHPRVTPAEQAQIDMDAAYEAAAVKWGTDSRYCKDYVAMQDKAKRIAGYKKTGYKFTKAEAEVWYADELKEAAYACTLAKRPLIRIGMTREQVENRSNWGKPKEVSSTTTANGTAEQWIFYEKYSSYRRYLYFVNDRLTAIQQ